ncbi:protein translocase subunit SecF [Faunimonas sp. B44]|uniref:protein translocase subunit SecF n=1 Tax=Faunimonas sp. B44 TaxID=3461493 RepID=UPI0040448954
MALRLVPDDTHIPFMRYAKVGFPLTIFALAVSLVLFFTIQPNYGIDFRGGTLIEIQSRAPEADLAGIRSTLGTLGLGDVEVQGFGSPNEATIRIATQEGGEQAQQDAVRRVQQTLGSEDYTYRRVEVVGPRVSGELAYTGTLAVALTMLAIMIYIWFRFEWQFALGAIITLIHDAGLTLGFFALTQIDFNVSSIAAILTIVGYSLNDTVVIYDRIREILRKYKKKSLPEVLDIALNQTLGRTLLTGVTTLLALFALFFFGGEVIRSFTAAMIFGVVVGAYSSIFVSAPILIYFNLRPGPGAQAEPEAAGA